jgi:hypothetical protein
MEIWRGPTASCLLVGMCKNVLLAIFCLRAPDNDILVM